jgi:TonB family protein
LKKVIYILLLLTPWLTPFAQSQVPAKVVIHGGPMPTYPGGLKVLAKMFMDSIDAPKVRWQAREEQDDHPEITLALVVNEQGNVEDVKVLKSINSKTDARCVNLAYKLKFTPAMQDGKPIKVTYKLPLKFDMEFY